MRKSLLLTLLSAALVAFATFGCSASQPQGHQATASAPSVSGQVQGRHTAGSELVLVNNSAEPVFYIYMSSSSDPSFGSDLLGSDVLMVGSSFRITGIAPGLWDIRVTDRSGNKKEFFRQNFNGSDAYHLVIDAYGWSQ